MLRIPMLSPSYKQLGQIAALLLGWNVVCWFVAEVCLISRRMRVVTDHTARSIFHVDQSCWTGRSGWRVVLGLVALCQESLGAEACSRCTQDPADTI